MSGSGATDPSAAPKEIPTKADSDEPAASTARVGSTSTGAGLIDSSTLLGVSDTGISNPSRLGQVHAVVVSDAASNMIWFDYDAPATGSTERVQHDVDVRVQRE